jgi:hypothetical protein
MRPNGVTVSLYGEQQRGLYQRAASGRSYGVACFNSKQLLHAENSACNISSVFKAPRLPSIQIGGSSIAPSPFGNIAAILHIIGPVLPNLATPISAAYVAR